jgi:mRNA interferase RelE/StbE
LSYKVLIDDKVIKDLRKIDKVWQTRILQKIKTVLAEDPYRGRRLIGELAPYRRLRVGDYRIIYEIDGERVIVEVIRIRHRKEAY